MRKIRHDECDSFDEVQVLLQEVFDNQALMEAKIEQQEKEIQAMKTVKKEAVKKEKGFIGVWVMLALVLLASAFAFCETIKLSYDVVSNPELLYQYLAQPQNPLNTYGVNGTGVDVKFWGDDLGDYMLWDYSADSLLFVGSITGFDDDSLLKFGTGNDATLQFDGTNFELFAAAADTPFAIGSTTTGFDITYNFETAGTIDIDYDGDNMTFSDAIDLIFGTDGDWIIESDTAKTLEFIPAAGDETYAVNIGADTAGADLKLFGATTAEYLLWDASGDDLIGNYDTTLFTQTGAAANQFKVDATGTVAGFGIVFETTDGGVQVNADGAANGDISIDAADDITLTSGGDLILATTGTFNMAGALIANNRITTEVVTGTTDALTATQSGSTLIYTQTGGACTVTLPEATSATVGVWFIIVDANPTAASDLTVDPEGTGTINGDSAGNYIKCETDIDGQAVYIVCTAADTWYAVLLGASAAWTEE